MNITRDTMLDHIRDAWNLSSFRPLQGDVIVSMVRGEDVLAVLPTGSGKSLCYQAPAYLGRSCHATIVISPLIALMKDQVDSLIHKDRTAAMLASDQHPRDQAAIERRFQAGEIPLLYVSPERFYSPSFLGLVAQSPVQRIVIDEAHCISQWGHDFRPCYRELANIRKLFPKIALAAFTATATPAVRDDIIKTLHMSHPSIFVGDFDRKNLFLRVVKRSDISEQILDLLRRHKGESGIVYCTTRAQTSVIAKQIGLRCVSSSSYHAGMDDDDRTRVQDDFLSGKVQVVCATIAFGMGINHPSVRFVAHTSMPSSMEVYHQEIGRAGRDGEPAECVIFYDLSDFDVWLDIMCIDLHRTVKGDDRKSKQGRIDLLDGIDEYCANGLNRCRHTQIREYFTGVEEESSNCGACDHCVKENG